MEKKQSKKAYSFDYSKDLQSMVLEIHDIEGMFPFLVRIPKIPSIGIRKVNLTNKKSGLPGLQMT